MKSGQPRTVGCRNKDAGNIHLINKKPELFSVYRGDYTTQLYGDPYETTSIIESKAVFFHGSFDQYLPSKN